jgi:hypothetical protein
MKSGSLYLVEPLGPVRACTGIAKRKIVTILYNGGEYKLKAFTKEVL